MNEATTGQYQFYTHSQRSLKYYFLTDYMFFLLSTILSNNINLDFNPVFQLLIPCLVQYLKKVLDGKEHVSGLFLDLTKAFVAVSHSLILSEIERLGLRGKSLSWVSSQVTRQDFACCWKIGLYSYVA